jgi:NAD(P)-dependent dehydrogenase (short-subunit alcohol dehydrogenase family)
MAHHFGGFDHVLLAYGVLGEQWLAQTNAAETARILQVNLVSAAQWANAVAALFEAQGSGVLVVLGSVAGDRGKRSNYVYGAAKAGLEVLLQGIAHRFAGQRSASGRLRVALVKPGPTDTPMTAGMKKGGPLWSTPEAVARVVRRAADRGGVTYAPARWRLLMLVLRLLPRPIWNRLDI